MLVPDSFWNVELGHWWDYHAEIPAACVCTIAGVPETYKILQPFPKDNTDQWWSQKQVIKSYSIQGVVAKVKDTVANG